MPLHYLTSHHFLQPLCGSAAPIRKLVKVHKRRSGTDLIQRIAKIIRQIIHVYITAALRPATTYQNRHCIDSMLK